jgi:queuine tRNA-ribosyltransferase
MKRHEVHVFENGTASIKSLEAGETMHSQVGPDEEARQVYLAQTRLAERLSLAEGARPLVLFDIGMGIASNALAAIELAQTMNPRRPLHIVSFENTLEGLELSLQEPNRFPLQARYRELLEVLMRARNWKSADVTWELRFGDFQSQELTPEPEVIFYDFYSPKAVPGLWTSQNFKRLFSACENRRSSGQPTVLATYSAATFVRSALLLAGFYVGYGAKTSLKSETTLASTRLSGLEAPLGKTWLERLSRSSKPLPLDVAQADYDLAMQAIHSSSQFSRS